jgi:hypothetical protein
MLGIYWVAEWRRHSAVYGNKPMGKRLCVVLLKSEKYSPTWNGTVQKSELFYVRCSQFTMKLNWSSAAFTSRFFLKGNTEMIQRLKFMNHGSLSDFQINSLGSTFLEAISQNCEKRLLTPSCLSVCPPVRPSVCPPVRLSARPSVRPPVCPPARLSARPSVRMEQHGRIFIKFRIWVFFENLSKIFEIC